MKQLLLIFPWDSVQGTFEFPKTPDTSRRTSNGEVIDDWTTATFYNH